MLVVLTYEDLQSLPEDGRRYEILDGVLSAMPTRTTTQARVSRELLCLLHAHVTTRDLGEVLKAPLNVVLGRSTVVQPDLLFVAKSRLAIIRERAVEGPPDLVVEILSSSTEQRDRGGKQQLYARYGVVHYWRVDPTARTLTELVLQGNVYGVRATHTPSVTFRTGGVPELVVDLGKVLRAIA